MTTTPARRGLAACLFWLAVCQQPLAAGGAEQAQLPRYSADVFFETTGFALPAEGAFAFRADSGELLVSSDETGVYNAYLLDPLTASNEALTSSVGSPIFAVSWFPDDGRILYSQDGGGDELDHIYVREEGGAVEDLTPGQEVKAGFMGWETGGEAFYLFSNERDPEAFDVYRYDTKGYERELVYENNESLVLGDVSRDGRWLALEKTQGNRDSDLYLVELASAEAKPKLVTPHEGEVRHAVEGFTPDGSALVYQTDAHGEFAQAWTYTLDDGKHRPLVVAEWDVMYVLYSPSGRYRVSAINRDARTEVTVFDRERNEPLALPALPDGNITGLRFDRAEEAVALLLESDTAPADVYRIALAGIDRRRLTDALNREIDPAQLVEGEVARFDSYDGLRVPGILYRPREASVENPVPALVWVHGGPGGQSRKGYKAALQHLVNHGYAIYAINNRGSSGYGKTFFHLDDRRHGEADLGDVVASRSFLADLDWVDGERIGIYGGSYGGYMVAAALAFEPKVFQVGINVFGVTNWVRTLESIPPWWADIRSYLYAELGDPKNDAERLRRISPLFHAENIERPLLVVQGANDPRVLQAESDDLVARVRENGVPVQYVLFDDEGHGFRQRENRIEASEAYLRFLERYLQPMGAPTEPR